MLSLRSREVSAVAEAGKTKKNKTAHVFLSDGPAVRGDCVPQVAIVFPKNEGVIPVPMPDVAGLPLPEDVNTDSTDPCP